MIFLGYKKGVIISALLLVLLAGIASASFNAEQKAIKDSINLNEQAIYEIKITNNEAFEDTFRIRAPEIFWSVQSRPLYHYYGGIDIKGKSSQTVTLLINPIQYIPSGQYKIEIDIDSITTGVSQKEFLIIEIKPTEQAQKKEYMASVEKAVEMPSKIDPRNKIPVKIRLTNRNPKNITELTINAKGNTVQQAIATDLEPLEQKTLELNISIDPLTTPQKDVVTWTFTTQKKSLDPEIKQALEILPYSDIQTKKTETQNEFLKTVFTATFINKGNSIGQKNVEQKTNIFGRLFLKTEPKANLISKADGEYFSWDLSIKPQAERTIEVTRSYRIPFALIVLIISGIAAYYIFRSPVKIRKEVAVIGFEEGGISDMKVILHVKNRTGRNYEKVVVTDKVPSIAKLVKASEVGSLTPTKTIQTKDGLLIKWELEGLEKHEERVFSYTIKSKLSILGNMRLPRASARFFFQNKERKTKSNVVGVSE